MPSSASPGWYPDPDMVQTLRYWDGGSWTEHRSPLSQGTPDASATAPVAARAAAPGPLPTKVDNTVAWTLAFAPLLGLLITQAVGGQMSASAVANTALFVTVALNIALAVWDANKLAKAGVHVSSGWAVLVVPAYLVARARKVPGTTAIPIIWVVAFLAAIIISARVGPVAMDELPLESQLTSDIKEQTDADVTVDCPTDPSAKVGGTIDCTVSAPDGYYTATVTVVATDGSYTWEMNGTG